MSYLKIDSTSAQREVQLRVACQVITDRNKDESLEDRNSYSITSRESSDKGADLPFFKTRRFGRG